MYHDTHTPLTDYFVQSRCVSSLNQPRCSMLRHYPCTLCHTRRDDEENPYEGLCPQNLELRWMTEVTSSVYATPLITDLYSDGAKDVVVPSFVHHLEARIP